MLGGMAGVGGGEAADSGVGSAGTSSTTGGTSSGGAASIAPPLPDDLPDSPVEGEIAFSTDAVWMVDDVAQPTFEIHTPTASYWVVKSMASIVSMLDVGANNRRQWIDYSSSFRPLRGVPGIGTLPRMTTVLDRESQTSTHLRLECRSQSADWQWVWDFYVTHVTLTVNRTPRDYAFSYRGVPGGSLDDADQLVLSSGTTQSARNSYSGEFPGPFEWAYLHDTTLGRSLFMIAHADDDLPERYLVKDSDSALLSFGNGALTRTPQRFSLGLIESGTHARVQQRVAFITRAIR
jgi:hypothetical protein